MISDVDAAARDSLCGCEGTGRFRRAELDKTADKVALLSKYERELQEELKKVRSQIDELRKEG